MRIPQLNLCLRPLLVCLAFSSMFIASCGLALDSEAQLERGQEAFANGDYRAAIIDAKSVLQKEPDNRDARLLLGRASVLVGDGASAEKELRRAIELGASESEVLVDLGRAMLQQGSFQEVLDDITVGLAAGDDKTSVMRVRAVALLGLDEPEKARDLYSEILAIDASDIEAQLGVARTYVAEGNLIQARQTLDHVLEADEYFIPALQLSGALAMQMGNTQRALVDFGRAAELARANGDVGSEIPALYGQFDVLYVQQKLEEARTLQKRMQEIAPEDPRSMMAAARVAAADNKLSEAQGILQQVVRRAPDLRAAQLLLGIVHKEEGNLGQAEMYLSAYVTAAPEDARARMLLAETRLALNKNQEARQALEPLTSGAQSDSVSVSMAAGANLSLGEIDEAIALLEQGVLADPENVDLKVQLALAYFRNQRFEDANAVLESLPDMAGEPNEFRGDLLGVLSTFGEGQQLDALDTAIALREKWPGRIEVYLVVGSIQMAQGELGDARESFERALEVAPNDSRGLRYLAGLDIAEGDLEAAREKYHVILELEPDDEGAMVSLARLAAQAERRDEARDWLEKARAAHPRSETARALLAYLYLASRDFANAEEVANEAVQISPDDARLQYLLGLAQLNNGKFRDAEMSLGKAVNIAPQEADFRFALARAQLARDNVSSAIITLEDSLDVSLQHIPSGLLLASLRADKGDLAGAQEVARQLQQMHPDSGVPYALGAELLVKQGDLPAAVDAFDRALEIEAINRVAVRAYEVRRQAGVADPVEPLLKFLEARPLDANVRAYLAAAYDSLGEPGKANSQYELLLEQDPDNFVAANNLAWNYFVAGDDRAEALARRAFELRPDNGSVADTLGWILTNKGDLEEGVATLRTAVEIADGRVEIRYHLAVALAESGAEDEAKEILRELVESDVPFDDKEAARTLLARLES
jgi:cellulose synthase operon protein C